jgi:hypothetical protein
MVILIGYAATLYLQGFWRFVEILPSPFNMWNVLVTLAVLAPGLLLLSLGNRIEARRARRSGAIPP